jgi:hypothetical protein
LWNCGRGFISTVRSGTAVSNSEWFYSRDHSGKLVVSKKSGRDDQFGQISEGNFREMARDFVCKQKAEINAGAAAKLKHHRLGFPQANTSVTLQPLPPATLPAYSDNGKQPLSSP